MTPEEIAAFTLGKRMGRQEVLDEMFKLLKLDEKIAEAISQHENHFHGMND